MTGGFHHGAGAAAPPCVDVVADGPCDPGPARGVAPAWCAQVARFLGREPPAEATVRVHPEQGIAWTAGSTVHLYADPSGSVDTSQLPHELAHLVAGPSPTRLLSEGLAVHVAAELALGTPCWPTYRLRPSLWVAGIRRKGLELTPVATLVHEAEALRLRHLAGRDALARAWTVYVVAGSFVGDLFASMPAAEFWELYAAGLGGRSEAQVDRLESRWRERLPADLDPPSRALMAASLAESRRQYEGRR